MTQRLRNLTNQTQLVRVVRSNQTVIHNVFSLNYLILNDNDFASIDPPLLDGVWEIEANPPPLPPPPPPLPPDTHTTDQLPEGTLNKYFTELRARDAVVQNVITAGVATMAPAQDAVFNALATKLETASNVGTGEVLFKQKSASDLEFKTLLAGANITLNSFADELEIVATGLGETNTASNSGLAVGAGNLFKNKVGTDLVFKKLNAGTNISIVDGADDVTINASGNGTNVASFVYDFELNPTPGTGGSISIPTGLPLGSIITRVWLETLTPYGGEVVTNNLPVTTTNFPGGTDFEAQSFTTPVSMDLEKVFVYLGDFSNQTGNLYLDIYAVDGLNKPTGPSLGQTNVVDVTTIPDHPTDTFPIDFSFLTPLSLPAGTYAWVLQAPTLSGNVTLGQKTFLDGVRSVSTDSGSSWSNTSGQNCFIIQSAGKLANIALSIPAGGNANYYSITNDSNRVGSLAGLVCTGFGGHPNLMPTSDTVAIFTDANYPITYGSFRLTMEYLTGIPV